MTAQHTNTHAPKHTHTRSLEAGVYQEATDAFLPLAGRSQGAALGATMFLPDLHYRNMKSPLAFGGNEYNISHLDKYC